MAVEQAATAPYASAAAVAGMAGPSAAVPAEFASTAAVAAVAAVEFVLALTLQLQRLLTLRWRLFIPRHFIQLRRLLAHIGLHLCQQLALLVRQLIGILHFATG